MKIDEDNDAIVFSDGRRYNTNCGIIGLSPGLNTYEGYDGVLESGNCMFDKQQKIELADYMIELWTKYKEDIK